MGVHHLSLAASMTLFTVHHFDARWGSRNIMTQMQNESLVSILSWPIRSATSVLKDVFSQVEMHYK
jgi:hypothetical protein